jgi:hypothetical protein
LSEPIPYGARIRIRGELLISRSKTSSTLILGTPHEPMTLGYQAKFPDGSDVFDRIEDNEIAFRYPFPGTGSVTIKNDYGTFQAGDVTPVWKPYRWGSGDAPAAPRVETLLDLVSPAPGAFVGLFEGMSAATLVRGTAGIQSMSSVDRGPVALRHPVIARNAAGVWNASAVVDGAYATHSLVDGAPFVKSSVKVEGTFVAPGSDSGGDYVWLERTAGMVERVRLGGSVTDRGPIPFTLDRRASKTLSASAFVHGDGTLSAVWAIHTGGFFDDMTAVETSHLLPSATSFTGFGRVGDELDDDMTVVRAHGGPDATFKITACALDSQLFESTTKHCFEELFAVGPDGTTVSRPTHFAQVHGSKPPEDPAVVIGVGENGVVEMACNATTQNLMTFSKARGEEAALFPCLTKVGAVLDAEGIPILLVARGGELFAATPR